MHLEDREVSRYFETGLLIAVMTGLGFMAYWGLM